MQSFTQDPRARSRLHASTIAAAALFAIGAMPPLTRAQDTTAAPLALGDVYRALERNPRLAGATALAAAAASRVPTAGLPTDPQVQLGWMNYALPDLAPMEPLGMTQLQVMQMVPLGGKLALSRGIARSRAAAAAERVGDVRWALRNQAAMAFFDLYRADASLAVMRETLRLLQDARRTAEAMYRVGEGRQVDVLRAQVEIARMTEDTLRMVAMRAATAARIDALLDRPGDAPLGAATLNAFPSDVPAAATLDSAAYANQPMLRAAAQELAAAGQMARLARREVVPDLTVAVQYGQRTAGAASMTAGETERMGSLMLGASVPVFARGRQFRARDEAEAMVAMARAEIDALRADTRGRIREALAALERARRLQALYRTTVLPQAEAAAQSALAAYRVGQVDFMTLLDNRMTVNRYRQELHALVADEGRAWAELEMLTGREIIDTRGGAAPTREVAP